MSSLNNTNIKSFTKLITPEDLIRKYPINNNIKQFIISTRQEIEDIKSAYEEIQAGLIDAIEISSDQKES